MSVVLSTCERPVAVNDLRKTSCSCEGNSGVYVQYGLS